MSCEDATKLEEELICKYNTTDPEFGYNKLRGGDNNFWSDEFRVLHSHNAENMRKSHIYDKVTEFNQSDEYRIAQSNRTAKMFKSSEYRQNWTESMRKLNWEDPSCNTKRRKASKQLWKDAEYVNKVKTGIQQSLTAERRNSLAVTTKRTWNCEETRNKRISGIQKSKQDPNVIAKWRESALPVLQSTEYKQNQRLNSKKYRYKFDDFTCYYMDELVAKLRVSGYPSIEQTTIRRCINENSWAHSKKYKSLDGRISRELILPSDK